jgi:thiol-disulfide isomerase/thioredoxin
MRRSVVSRRTLYWLQFTIVALGGGLPVANIAAQSPPSCGGGPSGTPSRTVVTPTLDGRAVHLLERAGQILHSARALRAIERTELYRASDRSTEISADTLMYMRPGYMRFQSGEMTVITPTTVITASGSGAVRTTDSFARLDHQYRSSALHSFFDLPDARLLMAGEWDTVRLTDPLLRAVVYAGRERWQDASYDVVEWVYEQAYTVPEDTVVFTTRVFIGADTLVHRIVTRTSKGDRIDVQVRGLDLNGAITAGDFVWSPRAGVVAEPSTAEVMPPWRVGRPFVPLATPAQLLDGPSVTSTDVLAKRNGVVVWWWATTCSDCVARFPRFEQLYRDFRERGIEWIAVDPSTDTAEIDRARRMRCHNHATMPILFGGTAWIDALREVGGGMFVLDGTGMVVYDGPEDVDAIRAVVERLATPKAR